jgi:ATP-binding protein involved in chromosome partitioning
VFVFYNTAERKVIVEHKGMKKRVDPYTMRISCKCAACIDELSGAMIIKKEEIDPEVYPTRIEEKGNYAVAVVWSDGHRSSIYPYKRLTSSDIPEAK